ncbi:MFS transporter [Vibrio sp. SS-MA-C1-2]|uniref:MFS transporter n=1 Tax=Vibrio sp. SS-MA-C1-2 TaxID=2908646 RepID=UPI001F1AB7CF|nr:MFS transporter [Vibrio sp. SS-MA-C1-2]UJF17194.1 MFS transporter [Vibrio sp. SS-MA-C1-2]
MSKLKSLSKVINKRLITITVISTLLATILSSLYTLVEFNYAIKPELVRKTDAIGQVIVDDLNIALEAGIPLNKIRGMDIYLQENLDKYPELNFIAVSSNREVLFHAGIVEDLTVPVINSHSLHSEPFLHDTLWQRIEQSVSTLYHLIESNYDSNANRSDILKIDIPSSLQLGSAVYLGLDKQFIQLQLTDIFFDIGVILIAVLLICFEVILVLIMLYISKPLEESEQTLERHANGDFSVSDTPHQHGIIGRFSASLNKDSQKLQNEFQQIESAQHGLSEKSQQQLHAISSKYHLNQKIKHVGEVIDVRIPLFIFSFAEELQKSFMPLYIDELYTPIWGLSRDVILGLPISIFMLVIALITPFSAKWVDRLGQRQCFIWGLIPAILGYLGCAFATNSTDIIISRGITAIGYAIILMSSQSYIAAVITADNRAKGMSIFVGILMTATMCGTALGGIIADRIGYSPVFLISTGLAVVAGILTWFMFSKDLNNQSGKQSNNKSNQRSNTLTQILKNRRFVTIVLCGAIPTKIVLTGFLYFMVPLFLVSLDSSQAEIGRVMMVYSLLIIPFSPIASGIADRLNKSRELVVLGTILSGAVLISLYGEASILKVTLAVGLMGVAHAILKAPLIACALEAAEKSPEVPRTEVLALLRTAERAGSVFGPIIVAGLISVYSYGVSMAIMGMGIMLSGIVMLLLLNRRKIPQHQGERS